MKLLCNFMVCFLVFVLLFLSGVYDFDFFFFSFHKVINVEENNTLLRD